MLPLAAGIYSLGHKTPLCAVKIFEKVRVFRIDFSGKPLLSKRYQSFV